MVLWFFSAQAKGSIIARLKHAHGVTCPTVAWMYDGSLAQTAGGAFFPPLLGRLWPQRWAEGFRSQPTSRRLITPRRGGGPADCPSAVESAVAPVPPLRVPSSHVMCAAT